MLNTAWLADGQKTGTPNEGLQKSLDKFAASHARTTHTRSGHRTKAMRIYHDHGLELSNKVNVKILQALQLL